MKSFWTPYIIVLIAQLLLSNYFTFTPWITVSILPAMVLCIPGRIKTVGAMFIAFFTGLCVDFIAGGVIGLNSLALVPVALVREKVINLVFGPELRSRKKDFSIRRNGLGEISIAHILCLALFLVIYVWADAAGTRSFGFNAGRFAASLGVSFLFGLLAIRALASSDTR